MSSAAVPQRTSRSGAGRPQSLFYRDLASPISFNRSGTGGRLATPGQAAAASSLWRENFAAESEPPPPPVFTLEDRVDFSPEPVLAESPATPRTPTPPPSGSPFRSQAEPSGSPGKAGWWSSLKSDGVESRQGSPVDGVVQPAAAGALLALPPPPPQPQEVVRPDVEMSDGLPTRGIDEEWVTVFGFSPVDTNVVLREFEKCGLILKHIPGPRGSNWMHILYQSGYDTHKALKKDGIQINNVLIIGVKPVDPAERRSLNEKWKNSTNGGFNILRPLQPATGKSSTVRSPFTATPHHRYPQNGNTVSIDSGRQAMGAIALPAKSVVLKVIDLMFGI
ncbi:Nucleoporin NUP53 protein [Dioscorea alata]|uniref:Nucleoporin NUP53 protein n=1 Tax=Dioscorea alata TaxID=55571 RepID=A0ACB7UBF1_DIOAL|nr:Nucleoporin NUP53 protein [Dioscorea alata]